jgi:hypothetical protein
MKAITRRLRRLEDRMGLAEPRAKREARARLLARLEAGRRRVAELRGESVPVGARHLDRHGPGDPRRRPFTVDAITGGLACRA